MGTDRVPSVSQAISFDVRTCKQQGFSTHGAGAFKTVTAVGHATESTVLGASAGAGGFQSGIGHVVVNEVFHLGSPGVFPADAVRVAGGSLRSLCAGHRLQDAADVSFLRRAGVACVGTNSLWHPSVLLIHHVLMHAIAGTRQLPQGRTIVHCGLVVLPGHDSSIDIGHYGVLIGGEGRIESHEPHHEVLCGLLCFYGSGRG